jgi:hypothetical protein
LLCFFFLHFLGLENLIKFSLTCGPLRNLVRHVMEDPIECVVRAAAWPGQSSRSQESVNRRAPPTLQSVYLLGFLRSTLNFCCQGDARSSDIYTRNFVNSKAS